MVVTNYLLTGMILQVGSCWVGLLRGQWAVFVVAGLFHCPKNQLTWILEKEGFGDVFLAGVWNLQTTSFEIP